MSNDHRNNKYTVRHDYNFTISLPINAIARAWLFHFLPISERHVERNLVYSPENANEDGDKTMCRRAIIEKYDPHDAETVQESDEK